MLYAKDYTMSFEKERIPPDTYSARISQVIELGHVIDNFKGEEKTRRKIFIAFSLWDSASNKWIGEVGKELTFSLASGAKGSTLWSLCLAAIGSNLEINQDFTVKSLLNKAVNVTVEHNSAGNEKITHFSSCPASKLKILPEIENTVSMLFIDFADDEGTIKKIVVPSNIHPLAEWILREKSEEYKLAPFMFVFPAGEER